MAAFPPPILNTSVPEPLIVLISSCAECVPACCGVEAFGIRAEPMVEWLCKQSRSIVTEALGQFETLLSTIHRHRGRIESGQHEFNHRWPTPHDALNYFKTWRTEMAVAVSQVSEPTFFDPKWLTGDVIALRDAIEGERAFDRLPILADALEEAGCENPHILMHLREPSDHAHHCWVIDLLSCGTK